MFDGTFSFVVRDEPTQMRPIYICTTCQETFSDLENVKSHHQDRCRYFCDRCCCQFDTKEAVLIHAIQHDVKVEPELECEDFYLKVEDFSELDLRDPESNQTDVKKVTKILAEHNYHRTERLNKKESKRRPYQCKDCGTSFTGICEYVIHLRTHTFYCKECGKCFSTKTNFENHLGVHRAKKLFKCKECGKSFSRKNFLDNCFRVHTGEQPFKWNKCNKCFNFCFICFTKICFLLTLIEKSESNSVVYSIFCSPV